MPKKWGVFELSTGVLWSVIPPTKERAEEEAELVKHEGTHIAVPFKWGKIMENAFAHGRMSNGL